MIIKLLTNKWTLTVFLLIMGVLFNVLINIFTIPITFFVLAFIFHKTNYLKNKYALRAALNFGLIGFLGFSLINLSVYSLIGFLGFGLIGSFGYGFVGFLLGVLLGALLGVLTHGLIILMSIISILVGIFIFLEINMATELSPIPILILIAITSIGFFLMSFISCKQLDND